MYHTTSSIQITKENQYSTRPAHLFPGGITALHCTVPCQHAKMYHHFLFYIRAANNLLFDATASITSLPMNVPCNVAVLFL
jgi:hypothetical protein